MAGDTGDGEKHPMRMAADAATSARQSDGGFMRRVEASTGRRSPTTLTCGSGRWTIGRILGRTVALYRGDRQSRLGPGPRVYGDAMPGARWFVGARLNFAENLLRFRDENLAIVFHGEDGSEQRLSYARAVTRRVRAWPRPCTIWVSVRATASRPSCPISRRP